MKITFVLLFITNYLNKTLFISSSETSNNKQNLIVIYGLYRTFDTTCTHIFKHLVKPNLPGEVVIILHNQNLTVFNDDAIDCMKPYNTIITVLNGTIKNENLSYIEFQLMERAIEWIKENNKTFEYILKVRADNMVMSSLRIRNIYGEGSDFVHNYELFENAYQVMHNDKKNQIATWNDVLWAWVFTAGY
jgi:hypothetical protein